MNLRPVATLFLSVCLLWVGAGSAQSGHSVALAAQADTAARKRMQRQAAQAAIKYHVPPETPEGAPASAEFLAQRRVDPPRAWHRGGVTGVQVNVAPGGGNIVGDAANEPTIAIDPANPNRIVIAWRQFDTIANSFREAGIAYSHNRGATWTATTLDNGQFRSDPVLAADNDGNFYFSSLSSATAAEVFKSINGGVAWLPEVNSHGGDKQWITVDLTGGMGDGHIYQNWNTQFSCCGTTDFTRSINSAVSFQAPLDMPSPRIKWGTLNVGPDGTLYFAGSALDTAQGHIFLKSTNAKNSAVTPTFQGLTGIDLGGTAASGGINPAGLLGQVWIATDHSSGPTSGYIYVASSVNNPNDINITNVKFIRSVDGGQTWSSPVLVNDDPNAGTYNWFGTMSVAPNGRIDMIWNDTRNDPGNLLSEVFYSFSLDAGRTWSANIPVTPAFNPSLGYPQQNKIGDYYHMISDNGGANLAFAATFNGEEDVYFLRIQRDCNGNGIDDDCDIACGLPGTRCAVAGCGTQADCNFNAIPDVCDPNADCNMNGTVDICDIGAGAPDCDGNSILDACQSQTDCNGNTSPDFCDLADGTSADCNGNGMPDECDVDSNGNDVPDDCEGGCCTCGLCVDATVVNCSGLGGEFSGLGVLCNNVLACTPFESFAHDACTSAETLPDVLSQNVPFDNRCATNDGPSPVNCAAAQPFGTDLWYEYVVPCNGSLTVSLCIGTPSNFDTILAIYGGTGPTCTCPADNTTLLTCGDDTCGPGGGPSTVTVASAVSGRCYVIRVGGWSGAIGVGDMSVTLTCPNCGNGVLNAGEQCDTAGQSATCDANCTTPFCGDGTLNTAAGEECDDHNLSDGDGCSSTCCIPGVYGDVNSDGMVDLEDILCILDDFGHPANCAFDGDISPCGPGDETIDLEDILAVLDAFGNDFACPPPC